MPTIVLHQPQDLVNIAAAVRAMANMGLERLTLVDPAEFDTRRITGIAHRTEPIVEAARLASTLEEALAEATYVVGTSARARTRRCSSTSRWRCRSFMRSPAARCGGPPVGHSMFGVGP